MKTLNFTVNEQTLATNDANGLAVGSENYLEASFSFSDDWTDAEKVAEFDGYSVTLEEDACVIPAEVLTQQKFHLRVVGTNGDMKITTNTITIRQEA